MTLNPAQKTSSLNPQAPCPCQSGRHYGECCGPFHQGAAAATPEALMRSRYSAFALGLNDYLSTTWHPSTRPVDLAGDQSICWKRLEILGSGEEILDSRSERPPEGDRQKPSAHEPEATGWVSFRATFCVAPVTAQGERQAGRDWQCLEERSNFERIEGRWYYRDGDARWSKLAPERNQACPCGSGRKFKKCCG